MDKKEKIEEEKKITNTMEYAKSIVREEIVKRVIGEDLIKIDENFSKLAFLQNQNKYLACLLTRSINDVCSEKLRTLKDTRIINGEIAEFNRLDKDFYLAEQKAAEGFLKFSYVATLNAKEKKISFKEYIKELAQINKSNNSKGKIVFNIIGMDSFALDSSGDECIVTNDINTFDCKVTISKDDFETACRNIKYHLSIWELGKIEIQGKKGIEKVETKDGEIELDIEIKNIMLAYHLVEHFLEERK